MAGRRWYGVDGAPGPPLPPGRGGNQFIPRPETWALGDEMPWSPLHRDQGADALLTAMGSTDLRDVLSVDPRMWEPAHTEPAHTEPAHTEPVERRPFSGGPARSSAVLVPVVMGGPEPRVLFTRRSHNLRSHGGELSFPGGRADPGESPVETALRECWEEIGLDRRRVEIVGRLDVRVTAVSSAAIVPVVGIVDELGPLRPNPEEVEGVIEVPVRELLLPDISREERWRVASAEWSVWFFELVGDTLWGASAAILRELFCRILNLDPGDSDRHRFRFETDADQGDQLLGGQSLL